MTNDVHILVSVCFSFADHFFTGNRETLMTMESTKPVHLIGELDIYSCIEPTLVDFAPENKRIYEPP